jgi:hypothetical protein
VNPCDSKSRASWRPGGDAHLEALAFWENFTNRNDFLDSSDYAADKSLCISPGAWDLTAEIERK